LLACCAVGDGEAETGALATSWRSNKFLNPARDGAVLPILHLNGYKIASPTVLDQIVERIRSIRFDARALGKTERPRWPMLILRMAKGWTGPISVDGLQVEGTFRSHQVPLAGVREKPAISPFSKRGCSVTSRKSFSMPKDGSSRGLRSSHLADRAA
jgi:xylulose-5-phosphate/fructose-6-phosphate phosphoketolase